MEDRKENRKEIIMQYQLAPMEGITTYIYRNAYAHYFGGMSRYYTPFISPHKDKTLNTREYNEVIPEHNQGIEVVPQILTASTDDFLRTAKELQEMGYIQKEIDKKLNEKIEERPSSRIQLSREVSEIFEKWRRGNL